MSAWLIDVSRAVEFMPQTLELFWAIPACKESSACRYIKDNERIGMYVKNSGKELVSYFRLSPESVLIYAIINIASIKTRLPLIIDIRNIMWVNDKYI